MAIVLSLIVAAAFGTGDFLGGLSAKRATLGQVVGGSHVVGLIGVLVASLLIDNEFSASDLFIGMAGGAFGAIGIALLYDGLARGPMSVIAPLTAVTSAAVPAVWGVATGDRFAAIGWLGVALAFVAIWMTALAKDDSAARANARAIAQALTAGAGFGFFFILLDMTDDSSAPWPIVGARVLSATLIVVWFVARRQRMVPSATDARWLILGTGIFDTASNVLILYALHIGDLATVSVLSALYPISTIILARIVLHERMTRPQMLGTLIALVATAMIAAG